MQYAVCSIALLGTQDTKFKTIKRETLDTKHEAKLPTAYCLLPTAYLTSKPVFKPQPSHAMFSSPETERNRNTVLKMHDDSKRLAASKAVDFIGDARIVGLGTGTTTRFAIERMAELIHEGAEFCGVPTSNATADL